MDVYKQPKMVNDFVFEYESEVKKVLLYLRVLMCFCCRSLLKRLLSRQPLCSTLMSLPMRFVPKERFQSTKFTLISLLLSLTLNSENFSRTWRPHLRTCPGLFRKFQELADECWPWTILVKWIKLFKGVVFSFWRRYPYKKKGFVTKVTSLLKQVSCLRLSLLQIKKKPIWKWKYFF